MISKRTLKKVFIILFSVVSLNAFGQKHLIGFKGGINWANRSPNSNSDNRIGLSSGLTYEYLVNQRVSVGADLLYSQKGFLDKITLVDVNQNYQGIYYAKTKIDYISIPVRGGLNIGNILFGFLNIGIIPSILVSSKLVHPTFDGSGSYNGKSEATNLYNQTSKFDFAGMGEVGGGIKIANSYQLFASFAFQKSFTAFLDEESYTQFNMRHVGKVLSLGIKYHIQKEK